MANAFSVSSNAFSSSVWMNSNSIHSQRRASNCPESANRNTTKPTIATTASVPTTA
jgi:hypothetical protein